MCVVGDEAVEGGMEGTHHAQRQAEGTRAAVSAKRLNHTLNHTLWGGCTPVDANRRECMDVVLLAQLLRILCGAVHSAHPHFLCKGFRLKLLERFPPDLSRGQ